MYILVIDDSSVQRLAIVKMLETEGYSMVLQATTYGEGMSLLQTYTHEIDLILTDLYMPYLDGIDICRLVKEHDEWADIPIIMVTSSHETFDLQAAFEAGAMDYITKPPKRTELLVRVRSALKLKYEMDQRKEREQQLREEQERSERLLLNTLPKSIVERLKRHPGIIADYFDEATVLFADIVGFTPYAAQHNPADVVNKLNEIFSSFDALAEKYNLEKVKTIGDAYMVVAGVPEPRHDHAQAIAKMAIEMQSILSGIGGDTMQLRIGIHTGPVVAGVIGTKKFSYDLWGDTVNIASRMESHGCPGEIQVSEETYQYLREEFGLIQRNTIQVKGRGEMKPYLLMSGEIVS